MNIQPNNQTVEKCLKQRTYYIDFYQREYVWNKETVNILLDDIFYSFDLAYEEHKEKDLTPEIIAKYNWYYLNIYITNTIEGKEYIVDGQQRLTTLCLIATKLYHLACENEDYFENILDTLKDCVFGKDKYKGNIFWIDNEKRGSVMQHIISNPKDDYTKPLKFTTEENLLNRYSDIDKYIEDKKLTKEKLQAFIMYFLERLVLVELKIEKDDTPMVFEVINDRGVALKPFEILKGKLVGALDKDDTDKYSEIWEKSLNKIRGNEDAFFIDYLKGKFIFKKNAEIEKAINNEYHRYIFADNEIANKLGFRKKDDNHLKNIKSFIENNLVYYTDLYSRIKQNDYLYLSYNYDINDLSGQYQNILAACEVNDKQEQKKIETISKEIDRLYMLLRLNGIYSSNDFTEIQYNLNALLLNINPSGFRNIFDNQIIEKIKEARNVTEVSSVLEYDKFAMRGYEDIDRRPLRYFFARIEKFICDSTDKEMENSVHYISTKTGHKTGYHIEHILSRNKQNQDYFRTEEEFELKRNKLGGLLLLYNMDNIISNNEQYYNGKRKTYNNGLVWGRTLIDTFYHKTNSRFANFNSDFKNKTGLEFTSIDNFDNNALEYRSRLLYEIVKEVWEIK
ncbi:DUF262 domain-containing protein [Chryseobacterium oryctis]|uniref:DUF262 domain-containing protein n=1 Tax=Chryseobacterium oryctis TaxID=2952618 RepID=A0ABT3HRU6_9FLAO|nr:DUF262 domain-containing protein [Chryseobacterium oryctis]MCW3162519.1 DUF262 domain-containing protein [Chryseobacterium oryctis]